MRTSELRARLTRLVEAEPDLQAHVREAARRLDASPSAVGAVLRAMEEDGQLTSHWVGRSRVYAVAGARPREGRRRMSSRFPSSPGDWNLRPYFAWDRDLSWREFRDLAIDPRSPQSNWAIARLLDHARWSDTWRLVTPADVRRALPDVKVRHRGVWQDIMAIDDAAP